MPNARINGVDLYYELTGEAGSPLVLVHGSWGDHHTWNAVSPSLGRSFRVLTYDRRGHSQSERQPGQGRIQEDVEDLAGLIEKLELGPAHIVGNSFGASIVLRLAAMRPELFRTMVLHEPPLLQLLSTTPGGEDLLQQAGGGVSPARELLARGDMEGGARLFVERVALGPGAWDRMPPPARQTFIFNAPTFLDETRDPDALTIDTGALKSVQVPTLLTSGDQSRPWFMRIVDLLGGMLPNSERVTFAGAGHVPNITHPEQYVEALTAFAARHGAGGE